MHSGFIFIWSQVVLDLNPTVSLSWVDLANECYFSEPQWSHLLRKDYKMPHNVCKASWKFVDRRYSINASFLFSPLSQTSPWKPRNEGSWHSGEKHCFRGKAIRLLCPWQGASVLPLSASSRKGKDPGSRSTTQCCCTGLYRLSHTRATAKGNKWELKSGLSSACQTQCLGSGLQSVWRKKSLLSK